MSVPEASLTREEALKTIQFYDCNKAQTALSETEKAKMRQSLLLITSRCEWLNLGLCVDDTQEGLNVLKSYLDALGYASNIEANNIEKKNEPIYLKFSTQKMSYYQDKYTGHYRGVLISCQSEDDRITGTYGHFPLDLFDDN